MKEEFKKIAENLIDSMTLEEAATQIRYDSPAVESQGIPEYNWWGEGLHGLARAGTATVFPQAIALASMFDKELLKKIADVVSTEARAKYNESIKLGDRDLYKNITMWSPNVNIFRDARWGRGQETFGEDPYLTSRLGVAFIKGLQGDGKYMKAAGCAKHYAVHSGPEASRHYFDAKVSEKDIEETYTPAFEAAVKEADVAGVMGAYNRVNGEPACASQELIVKRLRQKYGFEGYIVSDFLALMDFHENHKVTANIVESAAMALKAGCDVNAGFVYRHIMEAYEQGLVTEEDIRRAAKSAYAVRAALGMFSDDCEYDKYGLFDIDTEESAELSYEASIRSVVMLKNDGILPLDKDAIKTIGVIGPTAASIAVLEGNYNGTSSRYVTNLQGIRDKVGKDVKVLYSEGSHLFENKVQNLAKDDDRLSEAEMVARNSDVVILCVGLDSTIEGEEGDTGNAFAAGDKVSLFLPESQKKLIDRVLSVGKPVVLVSNTGSAIDYSIEDERCGAILQSWYSGQAGGKALADILFGDACPSAKLPVTFYKDGTQPPIDDYSMKGRTYRYLESEPLYPFGYGLSYTSFEYSDVDVIKDGDIVSVEVTVKNTGTVKGVEIAELYIDKLPEDKLSNGLNADTAELDKLLDPSNQPKYSLAGFETISLNAGESGKVVFKLSDNAFDTVLEDGQRVKLKGEYKIFVGGQQPDKRSEALTDSRCLSETVTV
ncbi:MAG: glycoside hydrolase family 3 C-terminal domain-containing protein [Eubacterium sp.]|nr:glycoside hydrolase family 3 C-terminal domain-containing protein [Eubacterium sp.]